MKANRKGAILSTLSLVGVLVVSGCSSSGDGVSAVPNPYVIPSGGVQVATMRTFGDSYSVPAGWGAPWNEMLVAQGRVQTLDNYAVGGAQAAVGLSNSFNVQIDRFQNTGVGIGDRDLTIAYFGYNDIGRGGSVDGLGIARAGYQLGVNRLIDAGAIAGERRLFVTQIHDWSSNPRVNPALKGEVVAWNDFVASVANQSPNIVAVDLFTVFERVYQDPAAFGLVNVTDVNPSRSSVDFLYYDGLHFGTKGASIIARTYNHYLTRGWDWANSLAAGASAAGRLQQDIDSGLLYLQLQQTNDSVEAFQLGPDSAESGMVLDFAMNSLPGKNSRLGVALLTEQQDFGNALSPVSDADGTLNSTGLASYIRADMGPISSKTQISALEHTRRDRAYDDLMDFGIRTRANSSSLSVQQRFSSLVNLGGVTLAPWAGFTHHTLEMDTDRHQSLYTSPTRVQASGYNTLMAGSGLNIIGHPISLAHGAELQLNASLSLEQSLYRDSIELSFTESALSGVVQKESVDLGDMERRKMGMGAGLNFHNGISVYLGYSVAEQDGELADQGLLSISRQF
ncbi:hypothetical protein GH984_10010 [Spiribacter sp. C176]|uniref:Autotransporter domain-containing protein n=1 Tax=Spiribacter salilacus TaxID=2664894 RepID=A0A6N7QR74_9GAMM|nr:SGNH/GDSL hydrolase family protein [Spiribacter salilacus]MRH79035.1 hypothetical protein [Spiribacter salilacus]